MWITLVGRSLTFFKKVFYRPLFALYTKISLKIYYRTKHHGRLVQKGPHLLKLTVDACRKVGLEPFLTFGSLLGYYRERDIIGHDNDIDLGLLSEAILNEDQLEKLKEIMRRAGCTASFDEAVFEGELKAIGTRSSCNFWMPEWNIWIDIYFFYRFSGKIVYFEDRRFGKRYEKHLHMRKLSKLRHLAYAWSYPPEIFSEFTPVNFLGSQVLAPKQTEQYLTLTYGDWKKTVKSRYYANIQAVVWNTGRNCFDFVDVLKAGAP